MSGLAQIRPMLLARVLARLLSGLPIVTLAACVGDLGTAREETGAGPEPATSPLVAARSAMSMQLSRTACVVEGMVTSIKPSFDSWAGPRMEVQLADVVTHRGSCSATSLTLPIAGGPLPSGRHLRVSDMPRFQEGSRYVVFLSNTPWFYAPTTLEPLRVEAISGRNVLVNGDGYPLLRLDERGFSFGEVQLFQPDPDLPDGKARMVQGVPASAASLALESAHLLTILSALETARGIKVSGTYPSEPNRQHSAWDKTPAVVKPLPKEGCEGTVSDDC